MTLDENDLWVLSFYRTSEISGALFFGRLARSMRPGHIQMDMTRHFADEAQHARHWTDCIERLGGQPLKLDQAYQDQYLAAAGMPANVMEVLAITQVFEQRVINQYARHVRLPGVQPEVRETIERIMQDERWHIRWVREALRGMTAEYSEDAVEAAIRRCREADEQVYQQTISEHAERVHHLLAARIEEVEP